MRARTTHTHTHTHTFVPCQRQSVLTTYAALPCTAMHFTESGIHNAFSLRDCVCVDGRISGRARALILINTCLGIAGKALDTNEHTLSVHTKWQEVHQKSVATDGHTKVGGEIICVPYSGGGRGRLDRPLLHAQPESGAVIPPLVRTHEALDLRHLLFQVPNLFGHRLYSLEHLVLTRACIALGAGLSLRLVIFIVIHDNALVILPLTVRGHAIAAAAAIRNGG
mmetsp:Transcript_16703/g.27132  ORF Transcript_16703/g.27132 Transcript_16703/m.27132 type:complete len:224 (+) Transcript_16703:775-1446(+)